VLIRTKLGLGAFVPALDVKSLSQNEGVRGFLGAVAASIGNTLVDLVLVVIYVGFLLAEQGHIPEKIARLQKNNTEKEGEQVVRAIGHQVQTYLGVCTLASALMALCTYILLAVMGVDFAAFWALAMFILTYIPTVGAVGVVLPALMALAQFGSFGPAVLIAVVLFAIHFLLTSVIETVLLGRTLDLSPLAIIVSLTFWGLVWGVGGLFLAVPLTGAIAIICRHIDGLEWLAEVLSGSPHVRSRRRLRFGTS
jgi:predicted PurR-regulated permease PerM